MERGPTLADYGKRSGVYGTQMDVVLRHEMILKKKGEESEERGTQITSFG